MFKRRPFKASTINYTGKSSQPVKRSDLVWKRNNQYALLLDKPTEAIQDFMRVLDMLKDFETKYSVTRNQVKRML